MYGTEDLWFKTVKGIIIGLLIVLPITCWLANEVSPYFNNSPFNNGQIASSWQTIKNMSN